MGGRGASFYGKNNVPKQRLKIDIQLFASKPVRLPKKEYGKIIREIDDLYASKYQNKREVLHYSGSYKYRVKIHGFNTYTIISKRKIR